MTAPIPDCRHWREPRHRGAAYCRSPHLAGSRLVTPDFCALCPFQEKTDLSGSRAIDRDMSLEALAALLDEPPRVWPAGWEDWPVTADAHYLASERFLHRLGGYPEGRYQGRGIVFAGGGQSFFPSLYVAIRAVRAVGCSLPIQVWFLGRDQEMPDHFAQLLAPWYRSPPYASMPTSSQPASALPHSQRLGAEGLRAPALSF